jgi:polyisoprenoid-binding protein YceI
MSKRAVDRSYRCMWLAQLFFGVAALFASAFTSASTTITQAVPSPRYEIDSIATKTRYETKYLGFISVRGIFERMTGVLIYDTRKPVAEREASIHVVIDATSLKPITFDNDNKRQLLRGPEFFHVDKFPTIEFRSTKFRFEDEKLIAIDGTVQLRGLMRPASLTVKKSQCEPASEGKPARCTAHTEWVVNRFEFGMTGWAKTVSDEVVISVDLVATQFPVQLPTKTNSVTDNPDRQFSPR